MCGRYAITLPPEAVRAWFGYKEQPNFPPRYNVAPTQPIPIVCRDGVYSGSAERHFRLVRWGFVPGFAKDTRGFPLLINARAEGIVEKTSFRAAMIRRRCLVIADGYYEWRRSTGRTTGTPFLIRRADGAPLAFAGLWETWAGADGSEIDTACIITTAASGAVVGLHDRMPAILEHGVCETWLDADNVRPDNAATLLKPSETDLSIVEIGPAVNKVVNDNSAIQSPVGNQVPTQGRLL